MNSSATARSREFGDFQTPGPLADAVCRTLRRRGFRPAAVLEPTCGEGAFLAAAHDAWPTARLSGREIDATYVRRAKRVAPAAEIRRADFFAVDWDAELARLPDPLLVLGNPPWVTNAAIGRDGGTNLPVKRNADRAGGLDALTGRSNFDVSEWMLRHLECRLRGRRATLAMLVKTAVARRVIRALARDGSPAQTDLFAIDARASFAASVDACLFVVRSAGNAAACEHRVYDSLDASRPARTIAHLDDQLVADRDTYLGLRHLAAAAPVRWRSGVKHDCARVMELTQADGEWLNGMDQRVRIEEALTFPTVNATDVARDRAAVRRMIVPQATITSDPAEALGALPKTRRYLEANADALAARKSRIYRDRPPFAIFGVGDYTFQPWKVAVSGLHDDLSFRVIGPVNGRPVVPNDTVYFLGFDRASDAKRVAAFLNGAEAQAFYRSLIFPESKRPVTAALLGRLALEPVTNASHA